MACIRSFGISALVASVAGLGCSASTTGPGTYVTGETGGDNETGATDDTGTPEEDTRPALTYPEGPYGKAVGSTIPNLAWEGYRDGTGEWTNLSLLDYYDPDGTRGINAIKIGGAALW
jgi:hypothetical protein